MQYNNTLVDYAPRYNEGILTDYYALQNNEATPDYSTSGGGYYDGGLTGSGVYIEPINDYGTSGSGRLPIPDVMYPYDPLPDGFNDDVSLSDILVDYAPRDGFYNDVIPVSTSTEIPSAQSEPTFHDDPKAVVDYAPRNDKGIPLPVKSATPRDAAPVSKNLKPYIYAGIAIVAILIAAKVLSKK